MTTINAAYAQIPLDLQHRAAYGREDFLIASNNQDAAAWVDRWPEWPAPALILYGPAASGKTHLCAVWAQKCKAALLNPDDIIQKNAEEISQMAEHIALRHADLLIGDRGCEEKLFHLYNILKDSGRSVLLTSRAPATALNFEIPDLASRLRAAPGIAIAAPDETLLTALLVKLFRDRQITINDDVLQYILPRMERSFAAARDLVNQADAHALAEKRNITIPLIREILMAEY
jgi:DnaA regulatory inactivator Hda